jgi:glycosyltransferase involved in cell wall biosynthesis
MNIAFILPSLANKGPVILALELVNYFIKDGHRCDVYYFDNIKELDVPCFSKRISFFNKIDFNSYDIIHSHMFRPDLYCAIYKSKINTSTKVISTIHTAIYDDLRYAYGIIKSAFMIPIWKKVWEMKDHIVVLTDTAKGYYGKGSFKGLTVINNGREIPQNDMTISSIDEKLIMQLKKNYIVLGSLCVLDRRKGLEQILKLLQINKNYAFIVVGDGTEKGNLQNIALKYNVQERFLVLGPKNDGYRFMSYFDLFVIPSRSEECHSLFSRLWHLKYL